MAPILIIEAPTVMLFTITQSGVIGLSYLNVALLVTYSLYPQR